MISGAHTMPCNEKIKEEIFCNTILHSLDYFSKGLYDIAIILQFFYYELYIFICAFRCSCILRCNLRYQFFPLPICAHLQELSVFIF